MSWNHEAAKAARENIKTESGRKVTQAAFAELIGSTRRSVQLYEYGRTPPFDVACRWADACSVPLSDLRTDGLPEEDWAELFAHVLTGPHADCEMCDAARRAVDEWLARDKEAGRETGRGEG